MVYVILTVIIAGLVLTLTKTSKELGKAKSELTTLRTNNRILCAQLKIAARDITADEAYDEFIKATKETANEKTT